MAENVIQKKRLQAVNLFMGAVKNLRYYPPSSDMAVGSLKRAYASLSETLEQAGPLIFSTVDDHLTISACALTAKEQQFPHIRSLVEIMTHWGIRWLRFERDLEKDEFIRFLTVFKKTPDEIEADGGVRQLLQRLFTRHIHIKTKHMESSAIPSAQDAADSDENAPPHPMDALHTGQSEDSNGRHLQDPGQIRDAAAKLALMETTLFDDPSLLSQAPDVLVHWFLEGKDDSAYKLMEALSLGLEKPDPAIQDLAADTLTRIGNRLATENRLDQFWSIAPRLIHWVRSRKTFNPTVKSTGRLLQLIAAHFIQARKFESCLPILEAVHHLTETTDQDPLLTEFADEMRASVAEKETLNTLCTSMMRSDPSESETAKQCLVFLGIHAGEALLDLLAMTSDRSERIRVMAVLKEMGDAVLPLLLERLAQGGAWYFLRNLAALLGHLGNETHLSVLTPLLHHEDIRVQKEALNTLYNIGGNQRRDVLMSLLDSADDEIKISIVIMLGGLRHPNAVDPFLDILKNRPLIPSQNRIRLEESICRALGRIGDPKALPVLKEITESKRIIRGTGSNERVKTAAKEAMESIGKRREESEKKESINPSRGDFKSPETTRFPENDFEKAAEKIDSLIEKGDTTGAVSLLSHHIKEAARAKAFQKAEAFLEKMSEADPMALSEIYNAGEYIEGEKEASLDKDRMTSWGALYDTLTREETHALYFALKERRTEADVVLIQQGQKNDSLFFLEQGELKVVFEKKQKEYLIRNLTAGNVAGAESFFYPTVSTVSVVTQTAAKLSVLDLASLEECKTKSPALENKLRDFCMEENTGIQSLLEKAMERRIHPRFPAERITTVQLLYTSGKPVGKVFKGRLIDLSAGGLSFFIKLQNKESARMLLGRRLQMQFPISTAFSESIYEGTGTVVAVHYHLSLDYSVHVRFDTPMDPAVIEKITG